MRCQLKHLWNTIKEKWRRSKLFCKFHEVGCTAGLVVTVIISTLIFTLVYTR